MKLKIGLFIILVTCLLCVSTAYADFSGGSGTQDDPYLLSCADDLYTFQAKVNAEDPCKSAYFRLTGDIALNRGLDLANIWLPVVGFEGVFDGAGHVISGLYVPDVYKIQAQDIEAGTAEYYYSDETGYGYSMPQEHRCLYDSSGLFATLEGTVRNLTVSGRVETPWYDCELRLCRRDCRKQ